MLKINPLRNPLSCNLTDIIDGFLAAHNPNMPSVVINTALLGSSFSPLADPSSPFNGLLVYQRRQDLRPIVIANQNLLLGGNISGTIYAKWGHVIFAGNSTYNVKIVAGTVRLLAVLDMTLSPSALLPPAQDVFLVE